MVKIKKKIQNTFSDCSNMKVRVENIYNQNSSYFKNVRIISLDYTILYFFILTFLGNNKKNKNDDDNNNNK